MAIPQGGIDNNGLMHLIDNLVPKGTVWNYLGAVAPDGWMICNGTAISRTTYAILFAVVGTTYGVGDGTTTFNIPDFRGMYLRGTGTHGSLTMANGNAFAGAALGSSENDQEQSHKHGAISTAGGATGDTVATWTVGGVAAANNANYGYTGTPTADSVNGTPRIGDETRPVSYSINYIIKV